MLKGRHQVECVFITAAGTRQVNIRLVSLRRNTPGVDADGKQSKAKRKKRTRKIPTDERAMKTILRQTENDLFSKRKGKENELEFQIRPFSTQVISGVWRNVELISTLKVYFKLDFEVLSNDSHSGSPWRIMRRSLFAGGSVHSPQNRINSNGSF